MNTYETICARRSIREFYGRPVPYALLEKYVNAGRLAPQAANRQPLEFIIVDDAELAGDFFTYTKYAGYLKWQPAPDRKPPAYIVIIGNKDIQKDRWMAYDVALAAENICLAAWEDGVGSCMVGAFNKERITGLLRVPDNYDVALLVALGYPAHTSVVEEMKGDNIEYWRDDGGTFHVPKRALEKITHRNRFEK